MTDDVCTQCTEGRKNSDRIYLQSGWKRFCQKMKLIWKFQKFQVIGKLILGKETFRRRWRRIKDRAKTQWVTEYGAMANEYCLARSLASQLIPFLARSLIRLHLGKKHCEWGIGWWRERKQRQEGGAVLFFTIKKPVEHPPHLNVTGTCIRERWIGSNYILFLYVYFIVYVYFIDSIVTVIVWMELCKQIRMKQGKITWKIVVWSYEIKGEIRLQLFDDFVHTSRMAQWKGCLHT